MDIQQIITLLIVLVAVISLGRRLLAQTKGDAGSCGGCGGACGKSEAKTTAVRPAPQATPLITLSVRRRAGDQNG